MDREYFDRVKSAVQRAEVTGAPNVTVGMKLLPELIEAYEACQQAGGVELVRKYLLYIKATIENFEACESGSVILNRKSEQLREDKEPCDEN